MMATEFNITSSLNRLHFPYASKRNPVSTGKNLEIPFLMGLFHKKQRILGNF